jgi:hypothetical protein
MVSVIKVDGTLWCDFEPLNFWMIHLWTTHAIESLNPDILLALRLGCAAWWGAGVTQKDH